MLNTIINYATPLGECKFTKLLYSVFLVFLLFDLYKIFKNKLQGRYSANSSYSFFYSGTYQTRMISRHHKYN